MNRILIWASVAALPSGVPPAGQSPAGRASTAAAQRALLRAGMMPPPGMPRPPLEKYNGLRDWLEAEIDLKAAAHPNPGSIVLHRLNRTEYANVIRDLLDLRLDVTTLLPPDDAARGFMGESFGSSTKPLAL